MKKKELRQVYLEKRKALPPKMFAALNEQLVDQFVTRIDLADMRVLHTFLPMKKYNEPDTFLLLKAIVQKYKQLTVAVPRVNHDTAEMEHFVFEGEQQLALNVWEIFEPQSGLPVEVDQIDCVLVPLLAFDMRGHRVGYGKGFYDKFLGQCRADVLRIGLSLFPPTEGDITDIGTHDVPLHRCVTPDRVYIF